MAQATPEQREMSNEDLRVYHRGSFHRRVRCWCVGCGNCVAGAVGHDQLRVWRARQRSAAFLRCGFTQPAVDHQNAVGDCCDLFRDGAGVVQHQKLCADQSWRFLDPMETNKALYTLATSLDIITIWTLVLLGHGHGDRGRRQARIGLHCGLWMVGDCCAVRRGHCGHQGLKSLQFKMQRRRAFGGMRAVLFGADDC